MKRPPGHARLARARGLRRDMTDAERLLWRHLRGRQLQGLKFRRQMWLCGYIADFACAEAKLIVEADGSQHAEREDYDHGRTDAFAREGYRVLRFWNNDILSNPDGVLQAISAALPSPSQASLGPLPLPVPGEGS
jgi:very-short-patch-repair endonuclease